MSSHEYYKQWMCNYNSSSKRNDGDAFSSLRSTSFDGLLKHSCFPCHINSACVLLHGSESLLFSNGNKGKVKELKEWSYLTKDQILVRKVFWGRKYFINSVFTSESSVVACLVRCFLFNWVAIIVIIISIFLRFSTFAHKSFFSWTFCSKA